VISREELEKMLEPVEGWNGLDTEQIHNLVETAIALLGIIDIQTKALEHIVTIPHDFHIDVAKGHAREAIEKCNKLQGGKG